MKKSILFIVSFSITQLYAQNVGIGITTPIAGLQVNSNNGFMAKGLFGSGNALTETGAGEKLIWYPKKGALRAGGVSAFLNSYWNDVNIGNYSIALGADVLASGTASTALGDLARAFGDYSLATGSSTTATGTASTAMGNTTTASGTSSTALGDNVTASGTGTVAAGHLVSTNGHDGSFFFGDSDPNVKGMRYVGANDQFAARFNQGYYFISNDAGIDIGVRVLPGGNSWSALSDVKLKEKFLPVDEESFLKKISNLKLTTWNYKGQDERTFRHYGPMAQDFFEAFGKDGLGTIGCDTLINQQDFLGVSLIAIQALGKRTSNLNMENEKLKLENEGLHKQLDNLISRIEKLEKQKILE